MISVRLVPNQIDPWKLNDPCLKGNYVAKGLVHTVLFVHLIAAFATVSGTVVVGIAFEMAKRSKELCRMRTLLELGRLGALLTVLGILVAGVTGLSLVPLSHYKFHMAWVVLAIAGYVAILLLGYFGGRGAKEARIFASKSEDQADVIETIGAALNAATASWLNYLAALLMVAIIADMVFKP